MKSVVAPYTTRAICMRIVCKNGLTIRLTRYPFDLTMSNGQVYKTVPAFDFTAYSATASMSPNAIDLEGVFGFAGVSRDIVASGVFDNARAYLFACDFLAPVEDLERLMASTLGKTTVMDGRYKIEEIGLVDAYNQSIGESYQASCSRTFGDSGCGISLASVTVTGTVTGGSGSAVIDSSRAESTDFFASGSLVFTTGQNAGLREIEVVSNSAGGVIVLSEPPYYQPAIGDAYSLTRGCRRRRQDCIDYGNVENAMAFWDMPTTSQYAQRGSLV